MSSAKWREFCPSYIPPLGESTPVSRQKPIHLKSIKRNTKPLVFRALHWRHNGRDSISNHQPHDCLLNRLFRRRSKKTSKLRVTGLCVGNSLGTGEFPAQMASNEENVCIWWRHHGSFERNESWFIFFLIVFGMSPVRRLALSLNVRWPPGFVTWRAQVRNRHWNGHSLLTIVFLVYEVIFLRSCADKITGFSA